MKEMYGGIDALNEGQFNGNIDELGKVRSSVNGLPDGPEPSNWYKL